MSGIAAVFRWFLRVSLPGAFLVATILSSTSHAKVIHPGLSNPGFELGDFTDWTTSLAGGSASVVASALSLDGAGYDGFVTWAPVEGGKFALLRGGATDIYQKLSTLFTATVGDRVLFSVFLDVTEELAYLPRWNDDGYAKLVNTTTLEETMLFAASVSTLPNRGNSRWISVDYTITAAGNYRLEFGVRNVTDNGFSPQMGVDLLAIPLSASLTSAVAGEMHIHFVADTGLGYSIQYKNALTDAAWLHLADIIASSGPKDIDYNDFSVGGNTQRYYRVVTPPVP